VSRDAKSLVYILCDVGLVILSLKDSSSSSNKLEKADILELTVEYLRTISTETASSRAAQGYLACLREVDSFLRNAERPMPCALGAAGPVTPSSERIGRLRTELMSRLTSRASNIVVTGQQQHLATVPEVTSVNLAPVSTSPPTSRRVLADRNFRPVAPLAGTVSTTDAHCDRLPCDVTCGLPFRHSSSSSSSRAEQTSKFASGTPTVFGRDCSSMSGRHRRPGPYSLPHRSVSDAMSKPFNCSNAVADAADVANTFGRFVSAATSSPSWSSENDVTRQSNENENVDCYKNSVSMRHHRLDVDSDSESYKNELDDEDINESEMWRPW